ncbi:hypothetical protein [Gallaecimonas pentaromativorans]|uniref:Uncharacterized protein n=1 Tax=Gallaecimonas pentaromativorans TaxID=584787 RepID=A0A3N1Q1C8_9GAMM|nr:hypothetical protein [Gallaecimonas pentaromativorans]ROQ30636.1 hypothetical protein EDC28_101322 [Gallaecimonas pentaromativorans]
MQDDKIISLSQISPYMSVLLCETKNKSYALDDTVIQFWNWIDDFKDGSNYSENSQYYESNGDVESLMVRLYTYQLDKKPSWWQLSPNSNLEQHVAIFIQYGSFVAIHFSQGELKEKLRKALIKTNYFSNLRPVSLATLNDLFINEEDIRTLWMQSVSGNSPFMPKSKTIGGEELADKLDPIVDQFFMMSAVRTKSENETSVGINPFKSVIWKGKCGSWSSFENQVVEILDKLNRSVTRRKKPISILAYPIDDITDLQGYYDFSLIDKDFIPEECVQDRELIENIESEFVIVPSTSPSSILNGCVVSIDILESSNKVAVLTAYPEIEDYSISFTKISVTELSKNKNKNKFRRVERLFSHYPHLIKCWYESGHSIIGGLAFENEYRDVVFDGFIWHGFSRYSVIKEKPGSDPRRPDFSLIGRDDSLFSWVRLNWNSAWMEKNGCFSDNQKGWFFCDDGSGEIADFIHMRKKDDVYYISLIHVKAAGSDRKERKLSVGVFDTVVAQAVKNMRHVRRKNLYEELKGRGSLSKKKCWFDNQEMNPEDFLLELNTIKESQTKYKVIVIQPHITKNSYNDGFDTKIRKQLDAVLVNAKNAINGLSADFYVVGSE